MAVPLYFQTPLEAVGFSRISHSVEISAFLHQAAGHDGQARVEVLGLSVEGQPIEALVLPARGSAAAPSVPLRVMIVGSQHGAAEPAGGEALLVVVRELLQGSLQELREHLELILIPNANPDGRDLQRRSNARRVNINTDFIAASQPETQALRMALLRFRPDVLLDSHESAILKRETLARQGYLTDFHAQFEAANSPALPAEARRFMLDEMLPALTRGVTEKGLPSHRYIGEITSVTQPITNGGLTLQNFRNMAGISGTLSFLVETRLDSRDGTYPTYRNIGPRVERQLICLRTFLDVVYENREQISLEVTRLRTNMATEPVALKAHYVHREDHPEVTIPLRRLDTGVLEDRVFADHRQVDVSDVVPMPVYMAVTLHGSVMRTWLDQHHILYTVLGQPATARATVEQFAGPPVARHGAQRVSSEQRTVELPAGTLLIDLAQPYGRLAFELLNPASASSLFHIPDLAPLVRPNESFFVLAVSGLAPETPGTP